MIPDSILRQHWSVGNRGHRFQDNTLEDLPGQYLLLLLYKDI